MPITSNINEAINLLNDVDKKQIPYALSLALNDTIFDIKDENIKQIGEKFSNPNMNFLKKSFKIKKASKKNLVAQLWIREDSLGKGTPFINVLAPHYFGNHREHKRFEKALRYWGIIGRDEIVVPGTKAKKNKWGNITANTYSEIMSHLGLHFKAGYSANTSIQSRRKKAKIERTRAKRDKGKGRSFNNGKLIKEDGYLTIKGKSYFLVTSKSSHLRRGIYQKKGVHGSKLTPILLFVKAGRYSKIFDFPKIANKTIDKNFDFHFRKAFAHAKNTAK